MDLWVAGCTTPTESPVYSQNKFKILAPAEPPPAYMFLYVISSQSLFYTLLKPDGNRIAGILTG